MYYKRPQVCKIHLALNRGCFEAILMKNTLRTLGVKNSLSRKRNVMKGKT
jgi:hypothetical protein